MVTILLKNSVTQSLDRTDFDKKSKFQSPRPHLQALIFNKHFNSIQICFGGKEGKDTW